MTVKFDAEKLQSMIHYLDNVQVSRIQREQINCLMLKGILLGEINLDELMGTASPQYEASNVSAFLYAFVDAGGNEGEYKAQEMYDNYVEWCAGMDEKPETLTRFGMEMARNGVQKVKRADANHYRIQRKGDVA